MVVYVLSSAREFRSNRSRSTAPEPRAAQSSGGREEPTWPGSGALRAGQAERWSWAHGRGSRLRIPPLVDFAIQELWVRRPAF